MSLYNKVIDLQKLNAAWNHVYKNKPAAGVDHVSCEQFHENRTEELKQLQIDLREHRYETLPVKNVTLYKGEKARVIALYSMRDKVVQQSLATELSRIYEKMFSGQAYAYRSSRSALSAVNEIEREIQAKKYTWALKADIAKFFDTIEWKILENILKKKILEEDVLELIRQNSQAKILDDSGELCEKRKGLHQGSAISPVLSNIYLMEFDLWMEKNAPYFVRYSDDMIVLGNQKEELLSLSGQIRIRLEQLGLVVNENKTRIVSLDSSVYFLGYQFDRGGKAIPEKAKQGLWERLETMWLTSAELSLEDKLKKAIEIIGGWEQYFREKREIRTIFEYTALVFAAGEKTDYLHELMVQRSCVSNIYKDIALYLAKIWRDHGEEETELLEYEQFYGIWKSGQDDYGEKRAELLLQYRKLMVQENSDSMLELMQVYTDCHAYEKASFWMQKQKEVGEITAKNDPELFDTKRENGEDHVFFDRTTAGKLLHCFAGREDMFCLETPEYGSGRRADMQLMPLTEKEIEKHLQGKTTVGTYIQRPNATVRYMVVDVDISKKILLEHERDSDVFSAYLDKAKNLAKRILKLYRSFGMQGYLEYSGCRGFHVWLFFTEWIPVRYVNMFCDVLARKLEQTEDEISLEYFPNKTRIKSGKYGQVLKLPYGYHVKTGERSYFLEEDGSHVKELNLFLDSLAHFPLQAVKKVLAANAGMKEGEKEKVVDMDLDAFSEASGNVTEVLKKCNLMRYLCQKAAKTGYLTHFERLSLLYVFGHLGEEGQQFVHQVMSLTLNYQYNTTERFIRKIPEKPVSCIKLRSQYKQITAEYGCNCSFKHSKNCYPSPVLHVIALSNDVETDVTIPISRTMSKEGEKKVLDELNVHKKAQGIAEKILNLKKQQRSLNASIGKLERELGRVYDAAGVDCLEIEMGMLVRRKRENGVEWVIEI